MADRIAVMAHGKVVQVATPPEIYEAPNSRFVADFIGDVNIFDGTVSAAGNGTVEIATQSGFTVRVASTEPPAIGAKAGFAVRPEKIPRRPRPAGLCAAQCSTGRNLGYRLSRRHDGFPRQAEGRQGDQGLLAQRRARRRGPRWATIRKSGFRSMKMPASC